MSIEQGAPMNFPAADSGASQVPTPAPSHITPGPNQVADAYNVAVGGSVTLRGGIGMDDIASVGIFTMAGTSIPGWTVGSPTATSLVLTHPGGGGSGFALYAILTTNGGIQVAVPSVIWVENVA